MKTLNVTKCSDLKELSCDNNKLSKLNVSKCKELSILECNDNNLYELDAEKCRKISYLNCSNNKLAFLNLNTVLLEFSNIHCENNERSVAVDSNGQFDLSTLKGIDIDSIYLNSGGKLKGNILTFTSEKVKYSYYVCASMETDESEKQPIILSFYLKCDHSAGTVNKVTKATFEKNGVLKKVCDGCGKTIKKSTIYKMEKPKLSKTTYTYNEETKKPSVTVKDSNGKTLKKGTDYTVSYASGRKNPGKYKVTIKGKGKYSGTATKTFTIKPPKVAINSITSSKAKTLKIGWTKSSVVSGYQIYCSTSKDFKKDTVKINRKKGDGTSLTISGLKSGKTYYVKVRTYKLFNDEKIYSSWCKTKSKKIK